MLTSNAFSYSINNGLIEKLSAAVSVLEVPKSQKITLGAIIPTYYWDGDNFAPYEDACYLPVYADGKVAGIAMVHSPLSSSPTISLGTRFASILNGMIGEISDFCLIVNGTQTFYYGGGVAKLLNETKSGLTPYKDEKTHMEEGKRKPSMPLSKVENISASKFKVCSDFTEEQVAKAVGTLSGQIVFNRDFSDKINLTNGIEIIQKETVQRLNVGTTNQGSTMLCWACATVLTGGYISGNYGYDMYGVAEKLGIDPDAGGNNIDIINGLSQCFGVQGQSEDGYYQYPSIKKLIDRDDPIIAMCYRGKGLGHTVTVCGYCFDYPSMIISETYGEWANKYILFQANSDGSFDIHTNGAAYRWMYSVLANQ